MFEPMFAGGPLDDFVKFAMLAVAAVLLLVGILWIRRITKDIEDN